MGKVKIAPEKGMFQAVRVVCSLLTGLGVGAEEGVKGRGLPDQHPRCTEKIIRENHTDYAWESYHLICILQIRKGM